MLTLLALMLGLTAAEPQAATGTIISADEIAAAASLLQGQAAEAQPVVVVRGLTWRAPNVPVADVIRPPEEDLFQ